MKFPYEDIVHLPHHVSKMHPQMPRRDRAAQFSPFAALTGHDAAIKETARLTDEELELGDSVEDILDRKHLLLLEHLREHPEVTFTYFIPDKRKAGGAYITKTGKLQKVDSFERTYVLMDKTVIPMDHLLTMESELFKALSSE